MTTQSDDAATDMRRRASLARRLMADQTRESDRQVLQEFAEWLEASADRLEQKG